jgi:hypothetical protein
MAQFHIPPKVAATQKNQINQITKIQLQDGTTIAFTDWTDRFIYSTADLLSGFSDQRISLFSYSTGEVVAHSKNITTGTRTATKNDTNLSNAAEMDSTEEALVYSLQTEIYQMVGTATGLTSQTSRPGMPMPNAGTVALLHARLIMALRISQKNFPEASIGAFNAGFGPVVSSTLTTATLATNGQAGHDHRWDTSVPLHIGGSEKFSVDLINEATIPSGAITFPTDTGADDDASWVQVRCNLRCLHKRPMG